MITEKVPKGCYVGCFLLALSKRRINTKLRLNCVEVWEAVEFEVKAPKVAQVSRHLPRLVRFSDRFCCIVCGDN